MRVLLIDDARKESFILFHYGIAVTKTAKTYDEGIKALKEEGPWDLALLDHDLGCKNEAGREMTGMDIMNFLDENRQFLPKDILIITSNPAGRQRMLAVLQRIRSTPNENSST